MVVDTGGTQTWESCGTFCEAVVSKLVSELIVSEFDSY